MDTSKRKKELPMTVPELKSTVYLLPEVAWPIIKQTVSNTGNHLHTVTWQGFVYQCEYLFSRVCPSDCQLQSWQSYNLFVYLFIGMLVVISSWEVHAGKRETAKERWCTNSLLCSCVKC